MPKALSDVKIFLGLEFMLLLFNFPYIIRIEAEALLLALAKSIYYSG